MAQPGDRRGDATFARIDAHEGGGLPRTMAHVVTPEHRMGTLHSIARDSAETSADDGLRWSGWMARAQAGDATAYQALLQSIVPYVRAIARRYLGASSEIDDAVQEVLILVHEIRHTYEPERPFKPWLGTIASRRCIDIARKRSRHARREVFDEDALAQLHDDGDTPEDLHRRRQDAQHVHRALGRLAPRMREAVRHVYFDETPPDAAPHAGASTPGAIKVACHRALKTLKAALGPGPTP